MDKSQLAINGGPMAAPDLPNRFHFGKEEKAAADALFDKSIATGNAIGYNGPEEEAFGKEFAEYLGGGYADGVNAGTNSVYVALKSLNLPPFSEVIVGCVTDPGGMMPIVELNCIPVPADTEPGSFNAGAEQIEARITERTSAIVVAHIAGEPADMPGIMKVAEKYNLPVVEDCAPGSHGSYQWSEMRYFRYLRSILAYVRQTHVRRRSGRCSLYQRRRTVLENTPGCRPRQTLQHARLYQCYFGYQLQYG